MRFLIGLLGIIAIVTSGSPFFANAESGDVSIWSGEWQGAELKVVVVTRGHEISEKSRADDPWWSWGNTSTDAYLFYWSEDQMVDLILDFSEEDGIPVARLYSPKTVEARQQVEYFRGGYTLPEDTVPDVIISPKVGDWLTDGRPNFDLHGYEANPTTGVLQWRFRVGSDTPGIATWMERTVIEEADTGGPFPHYTATMRADPSIPYELGTPLLPNWPLLSSGRKEGHWQKIQPLYFTHESRVVELNWMTGFHIGGMYQVNSISTPPETNFESPFAFYRFDSAAERYANLVVRSDIWPEGDRHGPSPQNVQRTAVRMSWTGDEPDLWRFSLSVSGNHKHENKVVIGDTPVIAVPYQEYPKWVAERSWSATTFVEAVDGETGSEGIYEYSVEDNHPVTEWINGLTLIPPVTATKVDARTDQPTVAELERDPWATLHNPYLDFPAIHPLRLAEGFRGEYSLNYDRRPQLYFSPLDNRVHLLHAHEGVWNLGNGRILRAANTNGDAFIDSWWIERIPRYASEITEGVSIAAPGRVQEQLFDLGDYLLYMSDNRIEFRELQSPSHNRFVDVPTDETRWRSFIQSISSGRYAEREPEEFETWIRGLKGNSFTLRRAEITDVRLTTDGFRFVLTLRHNFLTSGRDFAGIGGLPVGKYIVQYDGDFSIRPHEPPSLTSTLSLAQPVALVPEPVEVTIRNEGLQDLYEATVEIIATSPWGERYSVLSFETDLLAESTFSDTIQWAAPSEGDWSLRARVAASDQRIYSHDPVSVVVSPAEGRDVETLLTSSLSSQGIVTTVSALLFVFAVAGVMWWSQALSPQSGKQNDD
jgi:hypothetical protein